MGGWVKTAFQAAIVMVLPLALGACNQQPGAAARSAGEPGATVGGMSPTVQPQANPRITGVIPVKTEQATFAAGCFWGIESAFREVKGVTATAVGFMGGTLQSPSYEDVCTDRTGHAEVVHLEFDPAVVSYDQLLNVFWKIHNPTTLNRQGPDTGTQYRSAIFFYSPEQQAAAKASLERLAASSKYKRPIVTQIVPAGNFWRAEEYHQRYLEKNHLPVCHVPED
jgi:peptide-methionine (S)-S-oxide reductase